MSNEILGSLAGGELDGAETAVRYAEELVLGLACDIARAPVAVLLSEVRQVVEIEIESLAPLVLPLVGGVGIRDGRAVVSVRLVSNRGGVRPARRAIQAVLLGDPDGSVDWALEVDRVHGLVHARLTDRSRRDRPGRLPRWVSRAKTADGRRLAWIDVDGMIRDLTSGGAERDR